MATDDRYIPTLDGWRAVAIIGVMICHASFAKNPKLHAILSLGGLGVQIFFAISGFLITYKLIDELSSKGTISLSTFYTKRAFRILPPALTYLITIYIFQSLGFFIIENRTWLGSLFFFKNFYFKDNSWYLTHFWSLSVEEQFYLLWPCLLAFFPLKKIIICGGLLMLIKQLLLPSAIHYTYDYLLAGCALAYLVKNPVALKYLQKFSSPFVWFALLAVFAGGITNKIIFDNYYLCWITALLIVWTVINPNSFVSKTLELTILKRIGAYSYSIYLWQQLFCVMGDQHKFFNLLQYFPANIVMTFLCAIASYHLIEQPFIKFGRQIIKKKTTNLIIQTRA